MELMDMDLKEPRFRDTGEPIGDVIQRRLDKYKKLLDLIGNHTMESGTLRTFFLTDMCGLTDEQHKKILGQANNEHVWDDVANVLMVQRDQPYLPLAISGIICEQMGTCITGRPQWRCY